MTDPDEITALRRAVSEYEAEIARLRALIDSPIVDDFLQAVPLEAAHQQERWSADHDAGKTPDDWLWLVAYLCTKASQAARYGDSAKHRHHIITAGAALLNWHRHATGELTQMRPGVDPQKAEAQRTDPPILGITSRDDGCREEQKQTTACSRGCPSVAACQSPEDCQNGRTG